MQDSRPLSPAPRDIQPVNPDKALAGRFAGRTLLITGGARGIGRAAALRAAREGANVVVADFLETEGRQTLADIQAAGGGAIFVPADVRRNDDC